MAEVGNRGVSEAASVAALVGLAVLVTASVGISVLFLQSGSSQGVQANFSFQHQQDGSYLLITHKSGDAIGSDSLRIAGPAGNMTWTNAAGWNKSKTVQKGDLIQLSQGSPYGSAISSTDTVLMVYVRENGSTKVLDGWNRKTDVDTGNVGSG